MLESYILFGEDKKHNTANFDNCILYRKPSYPVTERTPAMHKCASFEIKSLNCGTTHLPNCTGCRNYVFEKDVLTLLVIYLINSKRH